MGESTIQTSTTKQSNAPQCEQGLKISYLQCKEMQKIQFNPIQQCNSTSRKIIWPMPQAVIPQMQYNGIQRNQNIASQYAAVQYNTMGLL